MREIISMGRIFDYAKYPTSEEYVKIYEKKKDKFEKIHLKSENKTYNVFDCLFNRAQEINLEYWTREFNNRGCDLANCYVMLRFYYDKDIPDEEWYISPGKDGSSIQYFPHFQEKHYALLYWFGFYMENYYTKFASLIDTIYHLINIKYAFGIKDSMGFNKRVSEKLKTKDKELYDFLDSIIKENKTYSKVSEFRNNITHNYRYNQVDSGIDSENENGKFTISMSVGNYTPTNDFVINIEQSIDLLSCIIDNIRNNLEN